VPTGKKNEVWNTSVVLWEIKVHKNSIITVHQHVNNSGMYIMFHFIRNSKRIELQDHEVKNY
jgi:hypothetical protein